MRYKNINEETLKNNVASVFFSNFNCNDVIKNIDFTVKHDSPNIFAGEDTDKTTQYILWAEAKALVTDPIDMLTQLILTIGKSKITDEIQPPPFLGCFDCKQITFVEYSDIMEIFALNDFNWNVTPSNTGTKEFKLVYERLEAMISPPHKCEEVNSSHIYAPQNSPNIYGGGRGGKLYIFDFEQDESELRLFINQNFVVGKTDINRIQINKNNFKWVYDKWVIEVKPTIELYNWEIAKANNIIDADFYLADLLSSENQTLKDKLYVVLRATKYIMDRHIDQMGLLNTREVSFKDNQKAHAQFWLKYERPPKEEYWDYIIERRDLLVPQDVRERKGSFFTPAIWVELSQKYLEEVFGENWQEEYYVWDCAAGTGNLLVGLSNKYNIWASTIDKADVAVMQDRIKNGANLLENHVFQFDFLNDDFEKLPQRLQKILKEEPEKLIIYINPPYAEATGGKTSRGTGANKPGVAIDNNVAKKYKLQLGKAKNEIFVMFLIRIYSEIPGCKIGNFAKIKALCSTNFIEHRKHFQAKLEKIFLVPSNTFDNVVGRFPIGFHIWDTKKKQESSPIVADVYDIDGRFNTQKSIVAINGNKSINQWIKMYVDDTLSKSIGYLPNTAPDFQNQNYLYITTNKGTRHVYYLSITNNNIFPAIIYFAVRKVIPATWLNDRDQFLYPNDGWKQDLLFQTDCLTYTLFHSSNKIQSRYGVNHWIPFTEIEVNARTKFDSSFMTDFLAGKIKPEANGTLNFDTKEKTSTRNSIGQPQGLPLQFSDRALEVFKAGKELWKYYHSSSPLIPPHKCVGQNVNASFYDIREYFQGRDDAGRMKSRSDDKRYNMLMENLKLEMRFLALQLEPKIYEYGFLVK